MASSAGAGNADGSAGEADCNTSGDDGAGAGAGAGASASGILDTTVIITPRSDSNRHELPPQQIDARVEDGALSLTQVELTAPNTPPRGGGGGGGRGRPANPLIEPVSDYRPGLRDGDEGAAGDDLNITQTVHSDPQFGTMTLLSSADGAGAGAGKQEQQTQPSSSSPRRPPAQTTAAAQARAGTYSPNTRLQMLGTSETFLYQLSFLVFFRIFISCLPCLLCQSTQCCCLFLSPSRTARPCIHT